MINKDLEDKYFTNGHWSILKSENRRAELKKERRLAPKVKVKDYSEVWKKAVSLAANVMDIKEKS